MGHAFAPGRTYCSSKQIASNIDLYTAVETAAMQPGVSVVSMSFGINEEFLGPTENAIDSTFLTPLNHGGVTFVAATGDTGAPGGYPAYSPDVLAVGGTKLTLSTAGNYGSETGWSLGSDSYAPYDASGGGQSLFENEPSFQFNVQHSGKRQIPDVAFEADPNTGVAIYDTFQNIGWFVEGGTSFAAPSWAALLAIANQGRVLAHNGTLLNQQARLLSALPESDFHEILSGNNGFQAGFGYNLVTGLGSPRANLVVAGLVAAFPGAGGSDATSAGQRADYSGARHPEHAGRRAPG